MGVIRKIAHAIFGPSLAKLLDSLGRCQCVGCCDKGVPCINYRLEGFQRCAVCEAYAAGKQTGIGHCHTVINMMVARGYRATPVNRGANGRG